MKFTAREYTDMIICYGMAGENASVAARIYAERFPRRERHPTRRIISRCVQRARETGSLFPNLNGVGRPRRLRLFEEERILNLIEIPGNSVRRVASILGLPRQSVHRTLQRYGLHPYHYQRVQQLHARDYPQRVYFCEGIFIVFIRLWLQFINHWRKIRRVSRTVSAEFIFPRSNFMDRRGYLHTKWDI